MRAVVFANGSLTRPVEPVRSSDLVIAADGGARHCRELGIVPQVIIGDLDSVSAADLAELEAAGSQVIRYPVRKDYTDLELALRYALEQKVDEVLVLAALGARWDQTLANLLLPAAKELSPVRISLIDGQQEMLWARGAGQLELRGSPGDTVSLIPLGGDAVGITTAGLEYPLYTETLFFGSTRGISNILLGEAASVSLESGLLLCVIIHNHQE
ncbi:MAG TPA: thiamine diphosphokinase [Anaerolineales bacterium]